MDDRLSEIRTAAIVGLGLIGGSMARDLAARGVRVLGWDADGESLRAAVDAGVVHHPLTGDLREVDQADVVVLAVPVLAAPDVLRGLALHLTRVPLITDVGSTKTSIVHAAEALGLGARFVGSHPLAGDHRSGWSASRTGMFQDARIFLTRAPSTAAESMHRASALWSALGGRPELIDPDQHDVLLAWRSHLPQAVSTVLAIAIAQTGTLPSELGPGGRDVTRLAGSDPEMWADILVDNADALTSAFGMMESRLSTFSRAVANRDREALRRMLAEARNWHQQGG